MQDTCHLNFLIDLAHCRVSVLSGRASECKSKGLGFNSSWKLRIVSLSRACDKTKKNIFLGKLIVLHDLRFHCVTCYLLVPSKKNNVSHTNYKLPVEEMYCLCKHVGCTCSFCWFLHWIFFTLFYSHWLHHKKNFIRWVLLLNSILLILFPFQHFVVLSL